MSGRGPQDVDPEKCEEDQGKRLICHKAMKTLCVGLDAVGDHIAHGDALGACEDGSRRTLSTLPGAQAAIDHSPFAVLAILGGVVLWAYKTAKARNDKAVTVTEEQEVNEDAELV